jgi:hypothetical protein
MPDIVAEMKEPKNFPKAVYYSQVGQTGNHRGWWILTAV